MVAYPLAVYVGLTRFSARTVGLILLLFAAPSLVGTLRRATRADLIAVLPVPLAVFCLLALSSLLNDQRFMLAMPVLINAVLLYTFATSLGTTPMVERFARLQDPSLGAAKVTYCRNVTRVWIAFFVFNGAASAFLAVFGPLTAWTLYTGLLSYVLIGLLAAGEYAVRKYRFRDYGGGVHDRLLARLFPPHPSAGEVP